jgi:Arc/MetJ family transcription regulator
MVEPCLSVWHSSPYVKKTLHIDDALLAAAKRACGASTDTETVRCGLEALIRTAAHRRLRALIGSEPDAADVPRRRPPTSARRKRGVA